MTSFAGASEGEGAGTKKKQKKTCASAQVGARRIVHTAYEEFSPINTSGITNVAVAQPLAPCRNRNSALQTVSKNFA
ncbi:hypothetical protein [Dryocola sp. BD613]|uniref:hypothetical protein n=1 Tax=Dryocola sp. BD613 TaxID=3133272 RepID=UPI003F4F9799